jgi:phospholipid transport system substrate-binding protein
LKRLSLVLLSCLLPLSVAVASPNDVIADASLLLQQYLENRKAELTENREALYVLVDEILLPRFDRKLAAQLVLGKHWRTADAAQKTRFVDAFYATLLHRYADGILQFDLGRLEILPYRGDETKIRTKVRTKVRLDDGTEVPVDYSLVKRPDGWLFYDVVIEGISYVRNFRAEVDSEINATSLEAVINRLALEAGGNAPE